MKMNKKLLGFGVAMAVSIHLNGVAMAASTNGTADALVITPIAITETAAMNFGTVAGGANADTIVMDTAGVRTITGSDAQVIAASASSAGTFSITGEAGQAYTVTFSASATLSNGTDTMTVDTFTDNAPSPIDGGGTDTLLVGGTLNVGANQASGAYSTSNAGGTPYTVTVNYN